MLDFRAHLFGQTTLFKHSVKNLKNVSSQEVCQSSADVPQGRDDQDSYCSCILTLSSIFLGRLSIASGSFGFVIRDCLSITGFGFASIQSKTGESECFGKSCSSISNPTQTQSPTMPRRPFQLEHSCITISVT